MMYAKRNTVFSVFIALLFILLGCAVKKDKFLNRNYHYVTARYNKYYNAKLLFDETLRQYQEQLQEDYGELLSVRPTGTKEQAQGLYGSLNTVIEKCNGVVQKHSMRIRGQERNNWIDETFLLLGQAYYYKQEYDNADVIFNYSSQFEILSKRLDCEIWDAENQIRMGNYGIAELALNTIIAEDVLEKRHKIHILEAQTELYNATEEYDKSIDRLERTIKYLPKQGDHVARNFFILGQLALKLKDWKNANIYFYEAERRAASYTLLFNAILAQAQAYDPEYSIFSEILEALDDLSKETKNKPFLDQIFYAKGALYEKVEDWEQAFEMYTSSLDSNANNKGQRIRTHLAKGELHYRLGQYLEAQTDYNALMQIIDEEHKQYYAIKAIAESLDILAKNYALVDWNDELLLASAMSEENQLIWATEQAEKQQREKEIAAKKKEELLQKIAQNVTIEDPTSTEVSWYFTDVSLVAQGKTWFEEQWGTREFRDDWRRNNLGSGTASNTIEDESELLDTDTLDKEDQESAFLEVSDESIREILNQIPRTEDAKTALSEASAEAYYTLGLTYKEKIKNIDLAEEHFTTITKRYKGFSKLPAAHYQLYRIGVLVENSSQIEEHRSFILEQYPNTVYSQLLIAPESVGNTDVLEQEYRTALALYNKNEFLKSSSTIQNVLSSTESSKLHPSFELLYALVLAETQGRKAYLAQLLAVSERYPKTPAAVKAEELHNILTGKQATNNADLYSFSPEKPHYLIVLIDPKFATAIETFMVDFTDASYPNLGLKTSALLLQKKLSMVSLKTFSTYQQLEEYRANFLSQNAVKQLGISDNDVLPLAQENYPMLLERKNLTEYREFLKKYTSE